MAAEKPARSTPAPPERLGKYEILDKIGQGAMGEVYKARDSVLNRFVAIKTMSAAMLGDPDQAQRFLREAQSAARLNHPNVVTLHDFGEDEGRFFMAMELLEGQDLKALLRAGAGVSLEQKLRLMEQILDGVAYAHSAGVVHRDLKPANIHVQASGRAKVMDFGLARLGESEMTRTGTVMGTPNYMSPEQVRGERAAPASDVFSLGAVFYELLAGRRAFSADSMHSVLYQVTDMQPQPLQECVPELPAVLAVLVETALDKDPARRWADAGRMREALELCRRVVDGVLAEDGALASLLEPAASMTDPGPAAEPVPAESPSRTLLSRAATRQSAIPPRPSSRSSAPAQGARVGSSSRPRASASSRPLGEQPTPTILAPAAASKAPLFIGLGIIAVLVFGSLAFLLLRALRPPQGTSDGATRALVSVAVKSQVEAARRSLELKDLEGAVSAAGRALEIESGNVEAQQVLQQAEAQRAAADDAARAARQAADAGNLDAASAALGRLVAIHPRHPMVAELSPLLDSRFKSQADESARRMKAEADTARRARATSLPEYAEAARLAGMAEALHARKQYAEAAQRFEEARKSYEAARRAASEGAARTTPPPVTLAAAPTAAPTAVPVAPSVVPTPLPPPASLAIPPPPPVTTAPPPVTTAPPPVTTAPPATRPPQPVPNDDAAVRQLVAQLGRAIEEKDLNLYRKLRPGLSEEEERRLRVAFDNVASQQVAFKIESIAIEGDEATVRAVRSGSIAGRAVPPAKQVLRLRREPAGWVIRDIQ